MIVFKVRGAAASAGCERVKCLSSALQDTAALKGIAGIVVILVERTRIEVPVIIVTTVRRRRPHGVRVAATIARPRTSGVVAVAPRGTVTAGVVTKSKTVITLIS